MAQLYNTVLTTFFEVLETYSPPAPPKPLKPLSYLRSTEGFDALHMILICGLVILCFAMFQMFQLVSRSTIQLLDIQRQLTTALKMCDFSLSENANLFTIIETKNEQIRNLVKANTMFDSRVYDLQKEKDHFNNESD